MPRIEKLCNESMTVRMLGVTDLVLPLRNRESVDCRTLCSCAKALTERHER